MNKIEEISVQAFFSATMSALGVYFGIVALLNIMLTVFMNAYSMDGLHWNENFHKEYIYPQLKNAVINAEIST